MTGKPLRTIVVLCLGAMLPGLAFAAERPLPNDSRILTGRLDNGVRWMYRRHANPPGRMAVMMHIRTGSLNETDSQRGLAHFIEHMAFNGTEHFAPGKLIPYFESIGMKFGSGVNASTGMERTVYMLFLPNVEIEQIDKAMMVLSDYAFRITFPEAEVEKERSVILEETRSRKGADQRIRDKLWPELYAGSRLPVRLPIGDADIVANAPRADLVDYYRTWYRPEYMTILMVGDADPDPILPSIRKWFGAYRPDAPAGRRMGAELKLSTAERAILVTDPEITTGRVQMTALRPGRLPATTVEQWRAELVEEIANALFGRRCDNRVKRGQASFRSAGSSASLLYREALSVSASASGEPADWAKMLEELIVEVGRAREYGFDEEEIELVRKEVIASSERAVRTESTLNARTLLDLMVNAVNDEIPVLSAQQRLDLVRELLPSITAAEVSGTFQRLFTPGAFAYVVMLPEKPGVAVPDRDSVLAAARAAWSRRVEPLESRKAGEGFLAALPAPGRIGEVSVDQDLGITSAWLSNGIRVHHRFMDYKKDSVTVGISFAGGGIEEKPGNIGVSFVAGLAMKTPATSRLDSTQIRDMLLGKNIGVTGGSASDDAFVVRASGSPEDLEVGLQLAHALITDGRIEETAFKNWRTATLRDIERNATNVSYQASSALSDLLSGGDPRRLPLSKKDVEALSLAQGQAWLRRLCREAPAEVAIVGDMSWDAVRPLIERYFGSLPSRNRSAERLETLRHLARKPGPLSRRVEVATVTPTAVAYAGFVGCEGRNVDDRRALELAANILTSRLLKTIREEMSLVYGISADSNPSRIYRDAGQFAAGAKCKPENAERVAEEIHRAFKAFAESGPTAEELTNAKKQILNSLDTGMKEPAYWLALLQNFDLRGRSLDEPKTEKTAYETMTAEQVQKVFAKYCLPVRSYTVLGIPVAPTTKPASQPGQERERKKTSRPVPTGAP